MSDTEENVEEEKVVNEEKEKEEKEEKEKKEDVTPIDSCPKGHTIKGLFEKPESYSQKPKCNICERKDLLKNSKGGFYQCPKCQWNKCSKCRPIPPIMLAIGMNDLDKVKSLSQEDGFKINEKYQWLGDKTVYMKACQSGNKDIVKFLISLKCDIKAQDKYQMTGLFHACASGDLEMVKFLKSKGCNIFERNINGTNCFHVATRQNQMHIIKYLISSGWGSQYFKNRKFKTSYEIELGDIKNEGDFFSGSKGYFDKKGCHDYNFTSLAGPVHGKHF